MKSRQSTLALLAIYATFASFGISYFIVRDVTSKFTENQQYSDKHETNNEAYLQYDVQQSHQTHQSSERDASTKFPIKKHIVTHGHPRTATTLLFNMAATSYFLYLRQNEPDEASEVTLDFRRRESGGTFLRHSNAPHVIKTHVTLDEFIDDNTVIFTTAIDKEEAAETQMRLSREGHVVAFVQDMESLKELGISGLVEKYVDGFGLSQKDEDDLIKYFSHWEILRQCCGQQMSSKWRNDLFPEHLKRKGTPHHPTCSNYDIDTVEQEFMKSDLFSLIDQYPNVQPLNKPSLLDDNLNGTYCSSYNYLVHSKGLNFWGREGRPVRSALDSGIKGQFKIGMDNLKPEGAALLYNSTYRDVWQLPDEEKEVWLETVMNAREEIEDNELIRESAKERRRRRRKQTTPTELALFDNFPTDVVTDQHFDDTHAIFLLSFGKEAAESTLVERCVLSLRRRGAFAGYVLVLTDAPIDRYQSVFDDHVIVMNPLEKHYLAEDGTPIKYSKENASLKYKRFKTFILDYFDMDSRLDSVDLVYYLDIDIMAGNTLNMLFGGVESKYGVLKPNEERSNDVSRAYFFTPLSKEWPLQGGTFILERSTSSYCLELWRREIDDFSNTERGRDQDALAKIYNRIQSGEETKCELVRMENENYLSLPTPRTFESIDGSDYPSLIHISNSVFAKRINEEAQNNLIDNVLKLTEEERESGKYGKAVVHVD